MLGIDLVTAGTLLTLAAAGGPAGAPSNPCPFVKTVPINVRPITSDVEFDYSKSLSQLQNQEMDTINPYGFSGGDVGSRLYERQYQHQARNQDRAAVQPTSKRFMSLV